MLYKIDDSAPPQRPKKKLFHLPLRVRVHANPNTLTAVKHEKRKAVFFELNDTAVATIHFFTGEILTGQVEVTKTEMVWRLTTRQKTRPKREISYWFVRLTELGA